MLHLQDLAKQGQQTQLITVAERFPDFLIAPCHVNVVYHVEAKENFYLLHLHTTAELTVACQRCMEEFDTPYENQTLIAVCRSDERAEELLEQYECIVSTNWQVDLVELIIDELHLYAPQFHPDLNDCDNEVNQILTKKIEPY